MKKIVLFSIMFFLLLSSGLVLAEEKCVYVFYGQGCPHCGEVIEHTEYLKEQYPDLQVEYFEVYLNSTNLGLLTQYFDAFNIPEMSRGVPIVLVDDVYYLGDKPVIDNLENKLTEYDNLDCPSLEDRTTIVSPELTLPKVVSLAVVDAINPCALAVLTLMLVAILTYNPKKRKNILFAGLAFTVSVFVMYMFYGLVIIHFFHIMNALTSVRQMLYTMLGFVAIILGLLNVKDFIKYTPGSLGTEMPIFLRPRVKKLISGVTSPRGAFTVGLFVTLFLLPCTIGPYVIVGGILSAFDIIQTIPWLLLYNVIFVLPMLTITAIVYLGMAHVEDVSKWKEDNIRQLHLISGAIMFLLGIAIVFGII